MIRPSTSVPALCLLVIACLTACSEKKPPAPVIVFEPPPAAPAADAGAAATPTAPDASLPDVGPQPAVGEGILACDAFKKCMCEIIEDKNQCPLDRNFSVVTCARDPASCYWTCRDAVERVQKDREQCLDLEIPEPGSLTGSSDGGGGD
ncbi:MAG: hypothetical protein GMKNLPBB_02337 [Myxococcota bacterium]|nr:hypothetical protein [Myxococcota bacterium]